MVADSTGQNGLMTAIHNSELHVRRPSLLSTAARPHAFRTFSIMYSHWSSSMSSLLHIAGRDTSGSTFKYGVYSGFGSSKSLLAIFPYQGNWSHLHVSCINTLRAQDLKQPVPLTTHLHTALHSQRTMQFHPCTRMYSASIRCCLANTQH